MEHSAKRIALVLIGYGVWVVGCGVARAMYHKFQHIQIVSPCALSDGLFLKDDISKEIPLSFAVDAIGIVLKEWAITPCENKI